MEQLTRNKSLLAQEYDLVLRLYENIHQVRHIPSVLVSQTALVRPTDGATRMALKDHLHRQGLTDISCEEKPHGLRFTWRTASPSITLVIPTRNNRYLLQPLLSSIFSHLDASQITINLVDNDSDDPATLAFYQTLRQDPRITILPYHEPFNYSQAINLGVSQTDADLVLLLNDDMQVLRPDWLQELFQWALRPEIGVVGGKLLRANHTIQHAGIVLGLTGFMGHLYLNAPDHYFGLLGSVDWYRNVLAVTGACQMIRRTVFNEVNGYDEGYRIAFGDIDFCLRVHQLGYQNMVTPFAQLYHYEGQSRGYTTPIADILRGYEQLKDYLIAQDPFFSPNLTYTRIPKCAITSTSSADRLAQIEERKKFYHKHQR